MTFVLYTLLAVMLAMFGLLVGIYVGYFNIETPTLAKQFEPTPTPTVPLCFMWAMATPILPRAN
ncbi:MAG: hypothetical protein HC875_30410 [Anaerolineales bacterium]|nr:hypothetical protein [Anaerolineales bacterium]